MWTTHTSRAAGPLGQCMLRLVNDDETPPEPDTDFAFLTDSEPETNGGLRTLLYEKTQSEGMSAGAR